MGGCPQPPPHLSIVQPLAIPLIAFCIDERLLPLLQASSPATHPGSDAQLHRATCSRCSSDSSAAAPYPSCMVHVLGRVRRVVVRARLPSSPFNCSARRSKTTAEVSSFKRLSDRRRVQAMPSYLVSARRWVRLAEMVGTSAAAEVWVWTR